MIQLINAIQYIWVTHCRHAKQTPHSSVLSSFFPDVVELPYSAGSVGTPGTAQGYGIDRVALVPDQVLLGSHPAPDRPLEGFSLCISGGRCAPPMFPVCHPYHIRKWASSFHHPSFQPAGPCSPVPGPDRLPNCQFSRLAVLVMLGLLLGLFVLYLSTHLWSQQI